MSMSVACRWGAGRYVREEDAPFHEGRDVAGARDDSYVKEDARYDAYGVDAGTDRNDRSGPDDTRYGDRRDQPRPG